MKVVFNTRYPEESSSMFYRQGLTRLSCVTALDPSDYRKYDIALFMTHKEDLEDIAEAKRQNPDILIGVCDPRGSFVLPYAGQIDFFILDSLEMKDYFAHLGKPMLTYCEYPRIELRKKEHENKKTIVIGYHGNKVHLSSFFPRVTSALDALSERHNVELWAAYNIKALGAWKVGLPKKIKVRHIQWHEKVYDEEFSHVDIGACSNVMPIQDIDGIKKAARVGRYFLENQDDYLIRFKMPSNPGRIIVCALLGIPVVTDFVPSSLQLVRDGENGLVAYSAGGWYRALEELVVSPEKRMLFSARLQEDVLRLYGADVQNRAFEKFCLGLLTDRGSGYVPQLRSASSTDWLRFHQDLWRESFGKFWASIRCRVGEG